MIPERDPIACFLPPYMLKELVERGSPNQKQYALRSLLISEQLRGQRAILGEISGLTRQVQSATKQRHVYDVGHGSFLPGKLVRQEGDPPTGDRCVDEAYDGSGLTYDLFLDVYQRNSIDGNGLRLDSSVHYQKNYGNAMWNGQQMVYGDGDEDLPEDERIFNRFTASLDVIAHELTHGLTQYTAKLVYWDQSGALNESASDVFGILVKQRALWQTAAESDWVIGANLLAPAVKGVGLRSMKEPGTAYDDPVLGKDPQPAHMRDFVSTIDDNGGVHYNSGIPNRAFYVTAREIGGYAWEKAGRIWYAALSSRWDARSTFQSAAYITYVVAGELFGAGSLEQKAVSAGWAEVGIAAEDAGSANANGANAGCLGAPAAVLRSAWSSVFKGA